MVAAATMTTHPLGLTLLHFRPPGHWTVLPIEQVDPSIGWPTCQSSLDILQTHPEGSLTNFLGSLNSIKLRSKINPRSREIKGVAWH